MGIFGNTFGWPHLLIILAVILLLFGAAKLPALAKSMGQSARVFKGEMKAMKNDDVPSESTAPEAVTDVPAEPREAAPETRNTASSTVSSSPEPPADPKL